LKVLDRAPRGAFQAAKGTILNRLLRKDVYLKLIAETTRVNGYLGSLASKDPTANDFAGPLQDAIAELAKVQLIGSRETSAASAELIALYGEAMMRLVGTAKPMHEAKIDIKISDDLYQQSFAQAQRVLAEITTENESGAPNQDRLASLFQSLKIFQEQYSLQADQHSDAWRRYNSMHRDFATAVLEEMKRLGPINIRLTCAIREEAGLDTDVSELKRRLEDGYKRASHAIDEVLRKFREPEDG
jgi:hypothetical protein